MVSDRTSRTLTRSRERPHTHMEAIAFSEARQRSARLFASTLTSASVREPLVPPYTHNKRTSKVHIRVFVAYFMCRHVANLKKNKIYTRNPYE